MDGPRILIAEDDDATRALLTAFFDKKGFRVEAVANGRLALERIVAGAFDVALFDVMMPEMDGVQTFEAIRALPGFEQTPVCFLTAKVHPAEVQRWHDLGISDVLSKPFSPALLPGQIRACWERWHEHAQAH